MKINSKTLTTLLATFIVGSYSAGSSDISSKMNQAQESNVALDEDILKVKEVKYLSGEDVKFEQKENILTFGEFPSIEFDLKTLKTAEGDNSNEIAGYSIITAKNPHAIQKMALINTLDAENNTVSIQLVASHVLDLQNPSDETTEGNINQILAAMKNPDSDLISVFRIYADMIEAKRRFILLEEIVDVLLEEIVDGMDPFFARLNTGTIEDADATNLPNHLIQKMLLKNPSQILQELHDLVGKDRLITLYIDRFNAILLLLLDPNLLLDNPSLFYSYQGSNGYFRQGLLTNSMFENRSVRKEIPIIEMIKTIIDLQIDKRMIPDLIRYLSSLKDALSTDKEYKGDKDAVIANIDEALKYIRQD